MVTTISSYACSYFFRSMACVIQNVEMMQSPQIEKVHLNPFLECESLQ